MFFAAAPRRSGRLSAFSAPGRAQITAAMAQKANLTLYTGGTPNG